MQRSVLAMGLVVGLIVTEVGSVRVGSAIAAPGNASPSTTDAALSQQAQQRFSEGLQQYNARQFTEAIASWQAALLLYRQLGDRRQESYVLGNIGSAYEGLDQYELSLSFYEQSLAVAEEINDSVGRSYALNNLGYIYESYGEYNRALTYFEQALQLARQRGDRSEEASTLNLISIVYKNQGRFEDALNTLQDSLAIAVEISDSFTQAQVLGNLGNLYSETGRYPEALDHYEQTLALMQTLDNRRGESITLQRLGNVYLDLGDIPQAIEYYQQSSSIARAIRDTRTEIYNMGNIGLAYRNLRDPNRALAYVQQSVQRLEELNDRPQLAIGYNSLGNIYSDLGDYDRALENYETSLQLARELGDQQAEAIALGNLGGTYDSLGNSQRAISYYEQSLAIAQTVNDRVRQGQALDFIGRAYFNLNNYEQSVIYLKRAVEVWEAMRPGLSDENQISLFETQIGTYQLLQEVLIILDRKEEALEISERGRARSFIELVASRLSPAIAEELQTTPPDIDSILETAHRQETTIVQYSILNDTDLAIWVIQPNGEIFFQKVSLGEEIADFSEAVEATRVAAALGRGSSLSGAFDGLVQDTRSGILEETESPELTEQASTEPLTEELPTEPSSLRSPQPSPYPNRTSNQSYRRRNRQLQDLYRLLIAPIDAYLPDDPNARVVFVPQGSLFLVPFAALQNEEGRYLIEDHTLLTTPSIQVMDLTYEQRDRLTGEDSLIVGNPSMPSIGNPPEPLSPLPNAEQEAINIAELLNTQPILGNEATEDAVVNSMGNARIVHLATHGLLEDVGQLGIPGAIALSPSRTEDGLLTASEILNLSLSTELVVLSACDTGRGRITGDGLLGLSRSFMAAGATSVIVSLWAVPDAPTAMLMTEFYRNLEITGDKAQALRQAMLTTMEVYPSSRDWAAFTLMGQTN